MWFPLASNCPAALAGLGSDGSGAGGCGSREAEGRGPASYVCQCLLWLVVFVPFAWLVGLPEPQHVILLFVMFSLQSALKQGANRTSAGFPSPSR